ncbi:MAG: N-acetylmuramoyl-L-alanine amidase [Deltaproteobacteria bacterium]|nr:N-acetylmuramoyl-L-alanine amidase [Deltaproteobacteria bacterium]
MRRCLKHIALLIVLVFVLVLFLAPSSYAFIVDSGHRCLVVIDPGHGGADSGAKGPGGMEEKHITLSVALKAAGLIKERGACRVLLTRSTDVFVPLGERTAFANRNKADIFVSIHANASLSKDAGGIETFFLSIESTDEEALGVAAFENSVLPLEGRAGGEPSGGLDDIMSDLVDTVSHHESSMLAEALQASLVSALRWEDRGVRQAPFAVLSGALMPAVLVEVGFISNPAEERRLASVEAHEKITGSIVEGLMNFRRALAPGEGSKDYVGLGKDAKKN